MLPKSLALQPAERIALWLTPPMLWIQTLIYPFVITLNGSPTACCGRSGSTTRRSNADQYYTPEELQLIVEESEEQGALRSESGQVLQELFEFGELTAGEVMVPRVRDHRHPGRRRARRICARSSADAADALSGVRRGPRSHRRHVSTSRICCAALERPAGHRRGARPLPVVPETALLDTVLATMRRSARRSRSSSTSTAARPASSRSRICSRRSSARSTKVRERRSGPTRDAAGRLRVPGTMRLDELGQLFDLELTHEDVDSVSGLVLTLLGRPPRSATRCVTSG